jgi:hypothetical protein
VRDHQPGIQSAVLDQKRRQPAHLRVDQHRRAPLRNRADLAKRHCDRVGREADRLRVEIAARDCAVLVRKDDRIVGHRACLDHERTRGIGQKVERRAHHLRLAAEAVGVLDAPAAGVAGDDLASVEQLAKRGGDANLSRLSAKLGDAGVERLDAALQRIDRQSPGGNRGAEHPLAREQRIERDGRRRLRAVDQSQPFLGAELQRLHPELRSAAGRQRLAGDVDLAMPHQRRASYARAEQGRPTRRRCPGSE